MSGGEDAAARCIQAAYREHLDDRKEAACLIQRQFRRHRAEVTADPQRAEDAAEREEAACLIQRQFRRHRAAEDAEAPQRAERDVQDEREQAEAACLIQRQFRRHRAAEEAAGPQRTEQAGDAKRAEEAAEAELAEQAEAACLIQRQFRRHRAADDDAKQESGPVLAAAERSLEREPLNSPPSTRREEPASSSSNPPPASCSAGDPERPALESPTSQNEGAEQGLGHAALSAEEVREQEEAATRIQRQFRLRVRQGSPQGSTSSAATARTSTGGFSASPRENLRQTMNSDTPNWLQARSPRRRSSVVPTSHPSPRGTAPRFTGTCGTQTDPRPTAVAATDPPARAAVMHAAAQVMICPPTQQSSALTEIAGQTDPAPVDAYPGESWRWRLGDLESQLRLSEGRRRELESELAASQAEVRRLTNRLREVDDDAHALLLEQSPVQAFWRQSMAALSTPGKRDAGEADMYSAVSHAALSPSSLAPSGVGIATRADASAPVCQSANTDAEAAFAAAKAAIRQPVSFHAQQLWRPAAVPR